MNSLNDNKNNTPVNNTTVNNMPVNNTTMNNSNFDSKRSIMLSKRLQLAIKESIDEGYHIVNINDDIENYLILFKPKTGLYSNQYHLLSMKTKYGQNDNEKKYPFDAPYIKFITKIFHSNISKEGTICLDTLSHRDKWSPLNSFSTVIRNIMCLLNDQNFSSPLNGEAANLYKECEIKFNSIKNKSKLSLSEVEKINEECFLEYQKKADNIAKKNDEILLNYINYFPNLSLNILNK